MGRQVSGRVATIARFKPVHFGHATVLEAICEQASEGIIGIGSSNIHDLRNPFTAKESAEMVDLVLKKRFSNYELVEITDWNNGPKWREMGLGLFGKLDYFVTANEYVRELLKDDYKIVHPLEIIPEDRRVPIDGTLVRITMAKGGAWEQLVPAEVSSYLRENKIDERFCTEYGLATLAHNAAVLLEAAA